MTALKQGWVLMLFVGGGIAFAGLKAPDFSVTVQQASGRSELKAVPPQGHHFNIQAPSFLELSPGRKKLRASILKEREIIFQVHELVAGTHVVSIFLCDDRKTFCENHRVTVNWGSARTAQPPISHTLHSIKPRSVPAKTHGFLVNQPKLAIDRAKREKKPLLIDFFGIWCPPCNQLDEEVFSSNEFRRAASKFIQLKLDADSEVSWELKSKYQVGGYPTVVFASFDGDEIQRIVGFRPLPAFLHELQTAWENRSSPTRVLEERAERGDIVSIRRLGRLFLERKEFDKALRFLSKDPVVSEDFFDAQAGLVEKSVSSDKNVKLIDSLEKAISHFPSSPGSIDRRMKLAELYEKRGETAKRNTILATGIDAAKALITNPSRLAGNELTAADLWGQIADAHDRLGQSRASKEAWKMAAAEYEKRRLSSAERGYNLELGHALWKSGGREAAYQLFRKLEEKYPTEFTFYYNHAYLKYEEKKYSEANLLAEKAFQYSYGDNRLRAASLLAKSLKAVGQKEQGASLVKRVLDETKLPNDTQIRTHRYVKTLRELGQ